MNRSVIQNRPLTNVIDGMFSYVYTHWDQFYNFCLCNVTTLLIEPLNVTKYNGYFCIMTYFIFILFFSKEELFM